MLKILISSLLFFSSAAAASQVWSSDQQEVVDAINDYLAAWNAFDAETLASFCAEDCDRIDARGNVYHGRNAIYAHYAKVFANAPPEGVERKLSYDIISVRFIAPDVAIVDANYTLHSPPPCPGSKVEGMNTVLLVKSDGAWRRKAHRQRIPPQNRLSKECREAVRTEKANEN